MNFPEHKPHRFKLPSNIRYYLLGLIVIGTASATTNFFPWVMMCLTGFFLAYLTKGMRRERPPQ